MLRDVPDISDVRVVRGLLEIHGVTVKAGVEDGELLLDATQRAQGAHARDRRARRLQPHPDPVLRAAAAPARRGVHPRPRRLPHRRPADRLPPRRPAQVRRDRRQAAEPASACRRRTACTARTSTCRTRASARPSRCCSPRSAREGVTELRNAAIEPEIMDLIAVLQKMGAIISVEPNRVILHRGRRAICAATPTARSSTATRPPPGPPPRSRPRATCSSRARSRST